MSGRFLIYLIILFIIILIGLFNFKKLNSPFKILTIFILITFISESLSRFFAKEYRNSSPVYPVYFSLQYFFLTAFYSFYLKNSRTIIAWSWPVVLLIFFINAVFFQTVWQFPSNNILISYPVYVLCSLLLFKNMLLKIEEAPLLKQELFWYNTSSLFLYLFTFFCWSFFNILVRNNKVATLNSIIYYLVIQNYIITGIAIYMNSRRNKKVTNAG